MTTYTTIDEYVADIPDLDKRAVIEKLRHTIRSLAPKAEECISYGMPAFRLNGRILVYFAAAAKHCSLFPANAQLIADFKDELKDFSTSKGTIRFTPDHPIPQALLKKIVKARIAENRSK